MLLCHKFYKLHEFLASWEEFDILVSKHKDAELLTELNKDSLALVTGNFIEVLSYEDLDRFAIPIGWDIFAHQMWLDFAINDILDESLDSIGAEVIGGWLVFGHVLSQADVTYGWALVGLQSEELQDPHVVFVIDVDVDEQNL